MSYTETMIDYFCEEYLQSDGIEEFLDYVEDETDQTREQIKKIIDDNIEEYIERINNYPKIDWS